MKTFFLRPDNNGEGIDRITELFKSSCSLHIAVAYFNHDLFADLIIERANRELDTFLLVNTSDILRPQEIGDTEIAISKALMTVLNKGYGNRFIHTKSLGLRDKGKYQNMHHKFLFTDDKVIFGSVNLTNAALNRNYEYFIESSSLPLIFEFSKEFSALWEKASEIFTDRDGEIRSLMCPVCERNEGVDFESYGPFCTWCGYKFKTK